MNKHRIWNHPVGLLTLSLALALSACGDDTEDGGAGGTGATGGGGNGAGGDGAQGGTGGAPQGGAPQGGAPQGGAPQGGGGSGGIDVNEAANDDAIFTTPFDAAPNGAGTNVYFTAYTVDGEPAVFRRAADGSGAIEILHEGLPLAGPFGIAISNDDGDIFIADPAAVVDPMDEGDSTKGQLFRMPIGGGVPTPVMGTAGFEPRGVEVGSDDTVFFTGKDPMGVPGVFEGGGTTVLSGSPFVDPSGIAVATDGRIFVGDTSEGEGLSRVLLIGTNDEVTVFIDNLTVGYPVGVALSEDESQLFVSVIDATMNTSSLAIVDVATQDVTLFADGGIGTNDDSAGLHRAKLTNTFAWASPTAGAEGTGTIYTITLNP
jgi:hypothetical protein